jgi:hypothetical protein
MLRTSACKYFSLVVGQGLNKECCCCCRRCREYEETEKRLKELKEHGGIERQAELMYRRNKDEVEGLQAKRKQVRRQAETL